MLGLGLGLGLAHLASEPTLSHRSLGYGQTGRVVRFPESLEFPKPRVECGNGARFPTGDVSQGVDGGGDGASIEGFLQLGLGLGLKVVTVHPLKVSSRAAVRFARCFGSINLPMERNTFGGISILGRGIMRRVVGGRTRPSRVAIN